MNKLKAGVQKLNKWGDGMFEEKEGKANVEGFDGGERRGRVKNSNSKAYIRTSN